MPEVGCRDELRATRSKEFLERLNSEGRRRCIPMTGSMALTHRCNLHCLHCYAGPDPRSALCARGDEVPTERWLSLIDEVADAGCLFLLLTGGEPMLRPDFAQIYRHAKTSGLLVTVFTNGTVVSEEIFTLFDDLPPHVVEISLYGVTAETHEQISGVPGSFARAIRAVEQLQAHGVRLRLKSVLMQPNQHEFAAIRALAEERYGVEFRMDAAIMPRLDGDRMPLDLRVPPARAAALELASPTARERWGKTMRQGKALPTSPRLYTCGAGVIGFHVEADGRLMPCLVPTGVAEDLTTQPFAQAWQKVVAAMAAQRGRADLECRSCVHKVMCGWCPAYARTESGRADSKSAYLCELGRCRRERLERDGESDE